MRDSLDTEDTVAKKRHIEFQLMLLGINGRIPPESVARAVLGMNGEPLNSREMVQSRFRDKVKVLRPDLTDDALSSPTQLGLQLLNQDKAKQLAELIWARDDLLTRVTLPPPEPGTPEWERAREAAERTRKYEAARQVSRLVAGLEKAAKASVTAADPRAARRLPPVTLTCHRCHRRIQTDEIVFAGAWLSTCNECGQTWRPKDWCGPLAHCTGCGRLVAERRGPRSYKRSTSVWCGAGCRQREMRRRWKRLKPSVCQTCGSTFTPPRADAAYCSSACRQKAYRHRKVPA